MRASVVVAASVTLVSCGGSKPGTGPATPPSAATVATASSPAAPSAATAQTAAAAEDAPLSLTEEKLTSYIAYRRELQATLRSYLQDVAKAGQHAGTKTTDAGKTATVFNDLADAGIKHKAELEALHQKYGITEAEDKRIGEAVSAVLGAKASESPIAQGAVKTFRDMQKQGGPAKQVADEYFKQMEENEKKGMAEATRKFGADAVELLTKHTKELHELQMDALKTAFGGGASPAAK